jgi:hypothetical protein
MVTSAIKPARPPAQRVSRADDEDGVVILSINRNLVREVTIELRGQAEVKDSSSFLQEKLTSQVILKSLYSIENY